MKNLFLLISICFISTLVISQENVQWRGENRDGIYNETELLKEWPENGPELLWHFDELGVGHASAAVTDNMVYTAGTIDGIGFVIALNHNGQQLWKTEYGEEWIVDWDGVRTTPMINEEKLYKISAYGVITCMNKNNGEILWKIDIIKQFGGKNIQWGITENLLIHNEKLFCTVGGSEHNVITLNKNTGELIWSNKGNTETSAYCSPIIINHNNRYIFITQSASSILGFDAEKGDLLWKHSQPNKYSVHANTPIYHDGQIYIVSGYGKGGVMLKLSDDGNSVTELWRNTDIGHKSGGFVLVDGRLYGAADGGNKWHCIDWNTGNTIYSVNMFKSGNIIYADGLLYCYSESGEVALVEPMEKTFKILGRFRVPFGEKWHWAHLVINNKKLYVRHGNSLMVYSIGK
ncbi:MAG: PQQ-binding-like beta-propeller repeat protein [Bacteroidales bacterium]|nr:PQQ-binding-like beta-propeller repeat protein [Bacteroidales bacterium]